MTDFLQIEKDIQLLQSQPAAFANPQQRLLESAESILENWLEAHGVEPTSEHREGYRLLALHHQGAKGNPSFNACRETCRELIYQLNLYQRDQQTKQISLAAMVAMHLLLFIKGKMEVAELGEFCCSSKAIRT